MLAHGFMGVDSSATRERSAARVSVPVSKSIVARARWLVVDCPIAYPNMATAVNSARGHTRIEGLPASGQADQRRGGRHRPTGDHVAVAVRAGAMAAPEDDDRQRGSATSGVRDRRSPLPRSLFFRSSPLRSTASQDASVATRSAQTASSLLSVVALPPLHSPRCASARSRLVVGGRDGLLSSPRCSRGKGLM